MGHPLFGHGRALTVTLAALALAFGLSAHGRKSASSFAAAADVNSTGPKAKPSGSEAKPSGPESSSEAIQEDSDVLDPTVLQGQFESVARLVAPAVVSISAAETASPADGALRADEMNPQLLQSLLDKTTRTIGTGFIVDPDGFLVTNEHVIEDSRQFWVTTDDHKVFPAIVVGADPRGDLAVLKIPATHLPTVRFATDQCRRGQWAITLGNPYGLATEGQMSLSVGVISATDRSLPRLASKEDRLYSNLIQTTAQINPGNSGGPLLDLEGRVIGIDTAVILPQRQTNGIGFALSITPELLNEIAQLEQGREMVYGYVGVTVTAPTPLQRHDAALSEEVGVCVESVEAGSPAAKGLKAGDLIVQIDGQTIDDTARFVRLVGAAPVGHAISLDVVRDGKKMAIDVTPVKRAVQFAVSSQNQRMYWRGMVLGPVPTNWRAAVSDAKHRAGILVVGIQDDSPLRKQGVCVGTVITAIAGRPVANMLEVQRILNDVPPEQCTVQTAADTTEVATAKK
ncbi:MAG: trypsin-like peptidase domain-containing protein [Tepidisphaeraceae bacterium]|jgi:serine protease Do